MAGINVDTEALAIAAQALGEYIAKVQANIQLMKSAAVDCRDNMGGDVVSNRSIAKLEECIKKLNVTLKDAEDLKKKILAKKKEIEDLSKGF